MRPLFLRHARRRRPRQARRDWQWRWRASHRWHERWHRHHAHFRHSLGARLIAVFLLLALLGSAILYAALSIGGGMAWAAPVLLLLTLALGFGAVRHLLRPLQALAQGAEAFGRGELNHRIRLRHHDELGDLAQRFNQMAADIQAMLDGKRALLLAISHELRSPLTRARLNAELVDEGPARAALLDDLAQMRDLITALLESERLGAGHSALRVESIDLNSLLVASFGGGAIELVLAPELPLLALDPMRMQLLLSNLVDNAERHNDAARGPVRIVTARTAEGVRLVVRDQGPGVEAAQLARLGEPFYRPDAARTRSDGGVGLGLSLCKLIAAAHRAPLRLRNAEPGLEASLELRVTG